MDQGNQPRPYHFPSCDPPVGVRGVRGRTEEKCAVFSMGDGTEGGPGLSRARTQGATHKSADQSAHSSDTSAIVKQCSSKM
jgi:hypothetical protein